MDPFKLHQSFTGRIFKKISIETIGNEILSFLYFSIR
jgi:hypothetical protein